MDVLRRRLLKYRIIKGLLSIEDTVEWIGRKVMHLFIRRVKNSDQPLGSILRMIDTN